MNFKRLGKMKYLDLLEAFNHLSLMNPWVNFNGEDLFIFNIVDKKEKYACVFSKEMSNNSFGASFFIGSEGFNTLHDIYSVKSKDMIGFTEYNSTNVRVCNIEELSNDEKVFLEELKMIKGTNNVIINTFKEGYASSVSTTKDTNSVIKCMYILSSLIRDESVALKEGFMHNRVAFVDIYEDKLEYSLQMIEIPFLQQDYKFKKASREEINEFLECERNDEDFYFLTKNLEHPISIKDCNIDVMPLFMLYASDFEGIIDSELIVSEPCEYRLYLINILQEFFMNYGIPKTLVINNRKIYFELKSLLDALNIEVIFSLENIEFDYFLISVIKALKKIYSINMMLPIENSDIEFLRGIFSMLKKYIKSGGNLEVDINSLSGIDAQVFNMILETELQETNEEEDLEEIIEEQDIFVS